MPLPEDRRERSEAELVIAASTDHFCTGHSAWHPADEFHAKVPSRAGVQSLCKALVKTISGESHRLAAEQARQDAIDALKRLHAEEFERLVQNGMAVRGFSAQRRQSARR